MPQQLPDVFKRIQDKKRQQRDLKTIYREALAVNGEYQQVVEELEALKIKKKKIVKIKKVRPPVPTKKI